MSVWRCRRAKRASVAARRSRPRARAMQIAAATGVTAPARDHASRCIRPSKRSRARRGSRGGCQARLRARAIDLLPLTILRQRGQIERTIRHEVAHVLIDPALSGRPLWVREGAAFYFADPTRRRGDIARASAVRRTTSSCGRSRPARIAPPTRAPKRVSGPSPRRGRAMQARSLAQRSGRAGHGIASALRVARTLLPTGPQNALELVRMPGAGLRVGARDLSAFTSRPSESSSVSDPCLRVIDISWCRCCSAFLRMCWRAP